MPKLTRGRDFSAMGCDDSFGNRQAEPRSSRFRSFVEPVEDSCDSLRRHPFAGIAYRKHSSFTRARKRDGHGTARRGMSERVGQQIRPRTWTRASVGEGEAWPVGAGVARQAPRDQPALPRSAAGVCLHAARILGGAARRFRFSRTRQYHNDEPVSEKLAGPSGARAGPARSRRPRGDSERERIRGLHSHTIRTRNGACRSADARGFR